MNDLDLCLEVVSRSCQPLRYGQRWISPKPLEIEAWFQRTTKWHMGYQMGRVTDDVTWPQSWCKAVRSAILATAWLLVVSLVVHCYPALNMVPSWIVWNCWPCVNADDASLWLRVNFDLYANQSNESVHLSIGRCFDTFDWLFGL